MDKLCRIRDLQRAVNQFEAAFEKRYGICLNEGMALCSLSNAERMCPGRLGELLGLTPSNTSKVLRSAESKGLVLRELCCKDRRQMHYSLTTKGRELLASVDCHPKYCANGCADRESGHIDAAHHGERPPRKGWPFAISGPKGYSRK